MRWSRCALVVVLSARLSWATARRFSTAPSCSTFALFFAAVMLAAFAACGCRSGCEIQKTGTGEYWALLLASTLGLFLHGVVDESADGVFASSS